MPSLDPRVLSIFGAATCLVLLAAALVRATLRTVRVTVRELNAESAAMQASAIERIEAELAVCESRAGTVRQDAAAVAALAQSIERDLLEQHRELARVAVGLETVRATNEDLDGTQLEELHALSRRVVLGLERLTALAAHANATAATLRDAAAQQAAQDSRLRTMLAALQVRRQLRRDGTERRTPRVTPLEVTFSPTPTRRLTPVPAEAQLRTVPDRRATPALPSGTAPDAPPDPEPPKGGPGKPRLTVVTPLNNRVLDRAPRTRPPGPRRPA